MKSFLVAIHAGSSNPDTRDVHVYVTVNFMLNKRKSKKAAGASPQTPLLSREGALPLPYPPQL